MKKIHKFLAMLIVFGLLAACVGAETKKTSPSDTADHFLTALENYDVEGMNKYLLEDDQLDLNYFNVDEDELYWNEINEFLWSVFFKKSHKIIKEEIDDDKAVVTTSIEVVEAKSANEAITSELLNLFYASDIDFDVMVDADLVGFIKDAISNALKDAKYVSFEAPLHLILVDEEWKIAPISSSNDINGEFFDNIFGDFGDWDI